MICPTCKEIDLLITERHGVKLDYCPQCRGLWIARTELDKILQHRSSSSTASVPAPDPAARPRNRRRSWYEKLLDF